MGKKVDNRSVGTSFESEFCEILAKQGFWAHNIAQNKSGQPADVIAVKEGNAFLIDCKVCHGSSPVFKTERVEENQYLSMTLWQNRGNGIGLFAVKFPDEKIYMTTLPELFRTSLTQMNENWFVKNACTLEEWISEH